MKSKFHIRWMAFAGIWGAVMALTWWNLADVDAVATLRKANTTLRREIQFQHTNAQRFAAVSARREALFMKVESLDLGMVSLRQRLLVLAERLHLEDLAISTEMNQAGDGRLTCKLALKGGLENVLGFLTGLNDLPYLVPLETSIQSALDAETVHCEMLFFIQYKVVAPTVPAQNAPEITAQPSEAQRRPL